MHYKVKFFTQVHATKEERETALRQFSDKIRTFMDSGTHILGFRLTAGVWYQPPAPSVHVLLDLGDMYPSYVHIAASQMEVLTHCRTLLAQRTAAVQDWVTFCGRAQEYQGAITESTQIRLEAVNVALGTESLKRALHALEYPFYIHFEDAQGGIYPSPYVTARVAS